MPVILGEQPIFTGNKTINGALWLNAVAAYADNGESIEVNKSADDGGIALFCWSTTDAERALIEFHKSASATIGTKALVANGEALGGIVWRAADSASGWSTAASIEGYIDAAPGDNDTGGRLVLGTTKDGQATPTEAARINSSQQVIIGAGTTTTNSKMGIGLTINQGGGDTEIFALKSSDVAHGITNSAETDTFSNVTKASATAGGATMRGYSSATESLVLQGMGATDDTTKTTAAAGYIGVDAYKKSGTAPAAPGADANLFTIRAAGTTRFIFDAEGTLHSTGGTVNDSFGAGGAKVASGPISLGNATEGGTGLLNIRSKRAISAAMSGATVNIATQIPSGAMILGAQFNVDTAITGATSWSAAFNTGSTTSLGSLYGLTQNTKVNQLVVPEIASAATDITITAAGPNFSAGVIEAIVYYIDNTSMANA